MADTPACTLRRPRSSLLTVLTDTARLLDTKTSARLEHVELLRTAPTTPLPKPRQGLPKANTATNSYVAGHSLRSHTSSRHKMVLNPPAYVANQRTISLRLDAPSHAVVGQKLWILGHFSPALSLLPLESECVCFISSIIWILKRIILTVGGPG